MKILFLWVALILAPGDSIGVMFWNLENFFDPRCDSLNTADIEFSPKGERRWTPKRFRRKCDSVAKGILYIASEKGHLPDIIGVAEIENSYVLRSLIKGTALSKLDYRYVHYDSPDPRGIDVGLLYRKSSLTLVSSGAGAIPGIRTRDILLAEFLRADGGPQLAVLVNHHPSKYGGPSSSVRREAAVRALACMADSLREEGYRLIIATGDFNDTPDEPVYGQIPLINASLPLHRRGVGSIRFDGRWELIDLFFLSEELAGNPIEVFRIPFLMTKDSVHSGEKPFRTYSGPRYIGGVSDHLPILLTIP